MSASVAGHLPPPTPDQLDESDRELLECERELWGPSPAKEAAVAERFGLSMPAYYQRLYRICQTSAAVKYDSVLVRHILETADQVTAHRHRVISGGRARG